MGEKPIYEELYDLKNDPYETTSVATATENKEVLKKLRNRCNILLKQAKGDNNLPDTYIQGWENRDFRKSVEKNYKDLDRLN
jgi:hypothetical protein